MWFSFSDPNACITRGEGPLVERNGSGRFGVEVIVSILSLLHPHSGSLRKATNGLGYCTSVCYRRGGGESESNNTRTQEHFFVSRDLQNKPKLAERTNHS